METAEAPFAKGLLRPLENLKVSTRHISKPRWLDKSRAAYSVEGPDSAPDVLSSVAGVSDKPLLAYLKDHVVRLVGGIACPNCNHPLRAIDAIIDFKDVGVVLWCWSCHTDILRVERRS